MKRWIMHSLCFLLLVIITAGCAAATQGSATQTPGGVPGATAYPIPPGGSGSSGGSGIITVQPGVGPGTSYPGTVNPGAGSGGLDASGDLVIGTESGGQTYTIKVGRRITLKLGEMYNWQVSVEPAGVVEPVMGLALARGVQGVYVGKSTGRAAFQLVGDPTCRESNPPCGMPSQMLTVTIMVE